MRKREERTECSEVRKGGAFSKVEKKEKESSIKNRYKKCPHQFAEKEKMVHFAGSFIVGL